MRWSATQRITGPWIAIEPAIASAILTARFGLKDLCVKSRWKPTVMPWPVSQYITTMISTSVQPSQPPQATGMAAATARNGTTMKTPRATCSLRDWVSPPEVARSIGAWARSDGPRWVWSCGTHGRLRVRTYATVTYATVSNQAD